MLKFFGSKENIVFIFLTKEHSFIGFFLGNDHTYEAINCLKIDLIVLAVTNWVLITILIWDFAYMGT